MQQISVRKQMSTQIGIYMFDGAPLLISRFSISQTGSWRHSRVALHWSDSKFPVSSLRTRHAEESSPLLLIGLSHPLLKQAQLVFSMHRRGQDATDGSHCRPLVVVQLQQMRVESCTETNKPKIEPSYTSISKFISTLKYSITILLTSSQLSYIIRRNAFDST